MKPGDFERLAKAIEQNAHIHHLSFYEAEIGDEGLEKMAESIGKSSLVSLNLTRNKLTANSIRMLAKALAKNKSIKELKLSLNYFQDEGTFELCKMLKVNQNIEVLEMTSCGVHMDGAKRLAKVLKERNHSVSLLKLLARGKRKNVNKVFED